MVTAATLVGLAFACHRVGKIDTESRCCVLFVGGSGESVGIILYVAIVAVMAVLYVHIFRTIRATRVRALQHSNLSPATNRSSRRVAASFVHAHLGGNGNDGSPGPAATATNSAAATAPAAGSVHRQRGSHKNDVVPNSSDASTKAVGSDARNVTSVSMNVVSSSRQAMTVRGEVREGEVEGDGEGDGEVEEEEEEENSSASQANVVTDSNSATKRGARRLRGIMRQTVAAAKPQDLSSSSSSGVEPDDRTRRPYATERQRGVRFVSLSPVSETETEADDAAGNDKSLEEDGQEDYRVYQVSAWQTARDSRSLATSPSSTDDVDQGIMNPCLDSGDSAQSGAAASEGNDTAPRHGTESATAAWTTAASRCVSRSSNNSRNSSNSSSSNTNNSAAAQQASTGRNNATSDNYNNPAAANVFVITNIGLRRDDVENAAAAAAVAASTRKNKRRKNTRGSSEDDDNDDNDTTFISVARGPSKRKDPRVETSCARGRADCNRTTASAAREGGAARSDRLTAAADRTEAAESAGNSLPRTKTMLTVATMFVLLYAPIIAIRTYEVLSASTARDDVRLAYAMAVAQLLVTLNSCVNFVIYGVVNGAFRLVLKQSFLRRPQ